MTVSFFQALLDIKGDILAEYVDQLIAEKKAKKEGKAGALVRITESFKLVEPDIIEMPVSGIKHTGIRHELALFLGGESWYDEVGWEALWKRYGVISSEGHSCLGADVWLQCDGVEVLAAEYKKLSQHPALLAGCRRRWIVVNRYAGVDVSDAAALWNTVIS